MPRYQIFNANDPRVKVVTYIDAPTHEAARAKARQMNRDYTAAPCPPRNQPRESSTSRTAHLREAALPLATIDTLVRDAVISDVQGAQDIEVVSDGTLRYRVGEDMY